MNKNIIISGVTGFLGKSVLEMIIRKSDYHAILPIRPKQSQTAEQRFEEIFTSPIFDSLKKEIDFDAAVKQRISCLSVNICDPQWGMSDDDFKTLADSLDGIINCAADVNFIAPLKNSISSNIETTLNIIELWKANPAIKVVHASTAYVNGLRQGDIPETSVQPEGFKQYAAENNLTDFDSMMEHFTAVGELWGDETEKTAALSKKLDWNDVYTFTKWLAERALIEKMPAENLAITRPSIIASTFIEPTQGWVDGLKVGDAIIYAYCRKGLGFFSGDSNGVLDYIPVDIVSQTMVFSMKKLLEGSTEVPSIVHCTSGKSNPLYVKDIARYILSVVNKSPEKYPALVAKNFKPKKKFRFIKPGLFSLFGKSVIATTKLTGLFGIGKAAQENMKNFLGLQKLFEFYLMPKYKFDQTVFKTLDTIFKDDPTYNKDIKIEKVDWRLYFYKHIEGLDAYLDLRNKQRAAEKQRKAS